MKKFTKAEVRFEHPGMGKEKCEDCVHYDAKGLSCDIVQGVIQPADWCDRFRREPYLARKA